MLAKKFLCRFLRARASKNQQLQQQNIKDIMKKTVHAIHKFTKIETAVWGN